MTINPDGRWDRQQDEGVTPSGPGHSRAEPEEVSALRASVPNAAPCAAQSLTPGGGRVSIDRNVASYDSARVDFLSAAIQLIVAIEWETPAILDGANVEHRCQILLAHAREARDTLRGHGVNPDNPEGYLDAAA